jgi:hypothetical protein
MGHEATPRYQKADLLFPFIFQEWWQHIFCFITGIFSLPWQFCVVRFFPAEWIPLGSWAGSIDEVTACLHAHIHTQFF